MDYTPKSVTGADIIFGDRALELLPSYEDIPKEFKSDYAPWNAFWSDIFFNGGNLSSIKAKEGVDRKQALCHLKAILGSFAPQHEHKIAGVAYLSSLWFEPIK